MSKEGIATFKDLSMGSLCNPHKQEDTLNDLRVQWVKMTLEIELENAVRRRFPGHSEGTYGRLDRWIDELGFIGSDVQFHCESLWRVGCRQQAARLTAVVVWGVLIAQHDKILVPELVNYQRESICLAYSASHSIPDKRANRRSTEN